MQIRNQNQCVTNFMLFVTVEKVMVSYSRFKHWFQYDSQTIPKKSTVVVTMFRDPYGENDYCVCLYLLSASTVFVVTSLNTVGVSLIHRLGRSHA